MQRFPAGWILFLGLVAPGCWPSASSEETAEVEEAPEPDVHDWNEDTDDSDDEEMLRGTLLARNGTSWANELNYYYCYDYDLNDCWWTLDGVGSDVVEPGASLSFGIPHGYWFVIAQGVDTDACAVLPRIEGVAGEVTEIELIEEQFSYTRNAPECTL